MENSTSNNENNTSHSRKILVTDYPSFDEKDSLLGHSSNRSSGSLTDSFRKGRRSLVDSLHSGGTATITNEVFNLVKNIVASGALAIPSGIAAFGNQYSAIFPAIFLMIFMGCINAYYFSLIGRVCSITGAISYREAWELSVGKRGAFIVSLVCICKPALGNLAYSMILADSLQSLFVTAGFHGFTRTICLWLVTWIVVFPLCLLKNLTVLAPSSILGICGMLFTVTAMTIRYLDGTYDSQRSGKFIADLPPEYRPSFGSIGADGVFSFRALILLCMLATAYVAHYNAPRFYVELKNNTIPRYNRVVGISYVISAAIYILLGSVGFLTFGDNCSGYILNNYSTRDITATLCRIAIASSVLFTYPIVFVGVRDGFIDLLLIPIDRQTNLLHVGITFILLLIITIMATCFQDLGIVMSLGGATLATAVIYIFPSFMFYSAVGNLRDRATSRQNMEVIFAMAVMCLGISIGSIGVVMAIGGSELG